jgi:hypothetical protein
MVNVLLSNDDLSVLGGPETVNVEVDFGPEGNRGSQIFVNNGKPVIGGDGLTVLAPDCQLFDLYINILSSDSEYQYVYQLQNVLGTATWVKLFKLVSNIYSKNYATVTFVNGEANINIPIAEILPSDFVGTASSENFNIQHNILNQLPVASAISVGEVSNSNGALVLPITLTAHELIDGAFEPIASEKSVHLFITMV